MAIVKRNVITRGLSGRLGRDLVFKVYGDKTVVCAYPRKSRFAPSVRQLGCRERFARAVAQVRFWLTQADMRRFLEGLKRKWGSLSAYHAGIRFLMRGGEVEQVFDDGVADGHVVYEVVGGAAGAVASVGSVPVRVQDG